MKSELSALNRLTDHKSKVSAHYFIKKNGKKSSHHIITRLWNKKNTFKC